MHADDDDTLLIDYAKTEKILGADRLNQMIANGRLRPIPLNSRPGAPRFRRSMVERLARNRLMGGE